MKSMENMSQWLGDTIQKMITVIKKYDTSFKCKNEEKIIDGIFQDYFKDQMYSIDSCVYITDGCLKNILAKAYTVSKEQNNMLILSLTAQILMERNFGVSIDYRGIIKNSQHIDTRKDFTAWLNKFISYH